MGAVTVNRERRIVAGSKRVVLATVTTAATGDTYNTKLKLIDSLSVDPLESSQPANSIQVTGGTITINYGGGGGGTFSATVFGT